MGLSALARRSRTTLAVVNESMAAAPTSNYQMLANGSGSSLWNAGGFWRLTVSGITNAYGSIYWINSLSSVFTASADFRISQGGGSSMWFFFGCSTVPTNETNSSGVGYVIERHDLSGGYAIAIRYAGAVLATTAWSPDTSFDNVAFDYIHGAFTVRYKGSTVLTYTDIDRNLPGNKCGWGAHNGNTGGTSNSHDIKNLLLTAKYGV